MTLDAVAGLHHYLPLLHPPGLVYDLNLLISQLNNPPDRTPATIHFHTSTASFYVSMLRLSHVSQNNAPVFLPQDSEHGNAISSPIAHME